MKLYRLGLLVGAILVAHSLCGQDSAPTSARTITVRGVVINDLTKEPIARSLVVSSDNRFATMTDEQGRFAFDVPEPLSNTAISVSFQVDSSESFGQAWPGLLTAAGWLTARKPGFLNSNHRRSKSDSNATGSEITIALLPEAVVTGKVILPDVADRVQVHLYRRVVLHGRGRWQPAGQVRARSTGEFRFADLEPGTYKLFTGELDDRDPLTVVPSGQSFGYPPVYFPNASDFQTGSPIQLSSGSVFEAKLSPLRKAYYIVKIPVLNATEDDPLMVQVLTQGRRGPGFELGYNQREQRVEGALPNGNFLIEVTRLNSGSAYGSTTIQVNNAPVNGSPLALLPAASIQVNAKLEFTRAEAPDSGGSSSNEVAQQFGSLQVNLEPIDEFSDWRGPQSVSRTERSTTLEGVMPGRYWVHVDSPQGFVAAMTAGEIDLLRKPLNVGPGSHIVIETTFRDDGGEISGTVEGIRAEASANAQNQTGSGGFSISSDGSQGAGNVYCVPVGEGSGQFRQAAVMPDGTFHLSQIPPGPYRVIAVGREATEIEYRNAEAMRALESKGQLVRVSSGQTQKLDLPLISASE